MSTHNPPSGRRSNPATRLSLLERLLVMRWEDSPKIWSTAELLSLMDESPSLRQVVLEAHRQEQTNPTQEQERLMVLLSRARQIQQVP